MKKCIRCKIIKEDIEFHKNKHNNDGLHWWCKDCRKEETQRRLFKLNPNKGNVKHGPKPFTTEQRQKSLERRKELNKIYWKKWRKENPEKNKKQKRKHYLANKLIYIKKAKAWKLDNLDKVKEIIKKYRSSAKGRITRQVDSERRREKGDGSVNKENIINLYKKQKGLCAITGEKLNNVFHIDHIIPLSKGGKNIIGNIQLLLPIVNMKKGSKLNFGNNQFNWEK